VGVVAGVADQITIKIRDDGLWVSEYEPSVLSTGTELTATNEAS